MVVLIAISRSLLAVLFHLSKLFLLGSVSTSVISQTGQQVHYVAASVNWSTSSLCSSFCQMAERPIKWQSLHKRS